MVQEIASNWLMLQGKYFLRWHGVRDTVMVLLKEDGIADYCRKARILRPESTILRSLADIPFLLSSFAFSCVIKLLKPLSSFKALKLESEASLLDAVDLFIKDLHFIVQTWIEGDETELCFVPYSPALNPDKVVWNVIKGQVSGRIIVEDKQTLCRLVCGALRRLRRSADKSKELFYEPNVAYILGDGRV